MEFTPIQKEILDWLKDHPESKIVEIVEGIKRSDSTVRKNLDLLDVAKEVICDAKRQPFLYSLNLNSETLEWRRAVTQVKRILLNPDGDVSNPILKDLKRIPRGEWPAFKQTLEQIADAIGELDDEGKLIDTLEIPSDRKVPATV